MPSKRVISAVSLLPPVILTYLPQLFSAPNCVHPLKVFLWFVFCHTSALPSACPLLPQFYTLCRDDDDDDVWGNVPHLVIFMRFHKYFIFSNC